MPRLDELLETMERHVATQATLGPVGTPRVADAPSLANGHRPNGHRPPPAVEIVVLPPRGYQAAFLRLFSEVQNEFDGGVLVSSTLPYEALEGVVARAGLSLDGFTVIDMVSAFGRKGLVDSERVRYVASPTLLEKALILATTAVERRRGQRRCVVVDSLSTLAFYNPALALEQMVHRLASMARMAGWGARFLTSDNPATEGFLDELEPLFDRVRYGGEARPPSGVAHAARAEDASHV